MIFVHSLLDRIWCRTALHLALAPRQTKPIIYDWSTFFMRWIILLIRCWCWTVDWRRSRIDYNLCITRQFSNNAMIRAFNVLMSSQFTVSSAALSFNRIQSKPIESQISSHGDYCDALILFFFGAIEMLLSVWWCKRQPWYLQLRIYLSPQFLHGAGVKWKTTFGNNHINNNWWHFYRFSSQKKKREMKQQQRIFAIVSSRGSPSRIFFLFCC